MRAASAGKCPKIAKSLQRRLLHDIFRIVLIAHQPARQPMSGVEVGQDDSVEVLADCGRCRFTRSVEGFRALATPWGTGNALNGLARVHLAGGDADRAERLLEEATAILRQAGPWFLSLTLSVRANLAVRRGNASDAIALLRESLLHIRALHDKYAFAYTLVWLAAAAVLRGDDIWAARILGARDAVTERAGATVVDKTVQDVRDQVERDVRARLGPARWDRAY